MPVYLLSPTYITRVYRKTTNCQNQAVKSVKNAKPQKQAYKRTQLERNRGYIKNLSSQNITDHEINLLSKGLKFIPTPLTKEQHIRRQLLQDFEQFARRMRLKYIFQWAK